MTEKENLLHFLRREPYDHLPDIRYLDLGEPLVWPAVNGRLLSRSDLVAPLDPPVCERPMTGEGYDIFGVHWTATGSVSHYTPGQPPRYEDIEDWRSQVKIPNVEKLDWDRFRREAQSLDTEHRLVHVTLTCGIFERGTMLTSMENCLMDLISDPENYSDLMGAVADYKIALIDKMSEYVHIDILNYHDDWGTAKSTFMSPDLWRQVIKPHTQRIYACMQRHGITISQHSCGCVGPLIPDMIEMGASMWDAQSDCNDLAALSRRYGDKLCITGNDTVGSTANTPPPPTPYPAYPDIPEFLYT